MDYNASEYYTKAQWLWNSVKQCMTDNLRKQILLCFYYINNFFLLCCPCFFVIQLKYKSQTYIIALLSTGRLDVEHKGTAAIYSETKSTVKPPSCVL